MRAIRIDVEIRSKSVETNMHDFHHLDKILASISSLFIPHEVVEVYWNLTSTSAAEIHRRDAGGELVVASLLQKTTTQCSYSPHSMHLPGWGSGLKDSPHSMHLPGRGSGLKDSPHSMHLPG